MDLQSIRQQKHQHYLKQKALDDEKQREIQLQIQKELKQLDDLLHHLKQYITDIKKFDIMKILMIVSTFLRQIDCEINLIDKYKKKEDIIPIFFSLVNKIIEIRESNSNGIPINEIKFLNNIKNNLYKIMDLINLDRSLLEIELMDTTNDVDYAKQVYKKINGF
jgi:hypothetical protein